YLSFVHASNLHSFPTKKQIELIYKYSYDVLKEAVEQGGTTIRSYVNGEGEMGLFQQELFVYGQENKACKSCGDTIEKFKSSVRGTHICPTCQKNRSE